MWILKKRKEISTVNFAWFFFYSFFHAWEPNSWSTPTAVSRGIFVFCSSAILVSLPLCSSALSISAPWGASVENLHSVLPASSPCSLWGTEQRKEKIFDLPETRSPAPLSRLFDGLRRMIFRVAPNFPDFSLFFVWRRSLRRLKMFALGYLIFVHPLLLWNVSLKIFYRYLNIGELQCWNILRFIEECFWGCFWGIFRNEVKFY